YFAIGPGAYLLVIHKMYDKSWQSKAKVLPSLLIYTAGMSVNNSIAVFDAVFGKNNEFLRTPKYGIIKNTDDWKDKAYNLPFTKTTLLEIFFGVYGLLGILISIFSNNPIFAPIIGIQTVGFFYISYLSLSHSGFKRNKSSVTRVQTKEERMANNIYKLAMIGIAGIILFGAYMAFAGYQTDIYPLDLSRGHLEGIGASSDPQTILGHLKAIKGYLPAEGNAVWIFPTETTNFARMQADLDVMITSVEKISTVPRDSSAFHTGMLDVKERAEIIQENIMDATPYMYVSGSNVLFSSIWVATIIAIFAILKRKKEQLKAYDVSEDV
ncbi:MAG: glycosyl transferase, partial [Thaumarchaeota archaeon]|nr:glycosyl transferase [Nitrososphaerota archaeon]